MLPATRLFFVCATACLALGAFLEAACSDRVYAQPVGDGRIQTGLRPQRGVHRGDDGCAGGFGDLWIRSRQPSKGDSTCEFFYTHLQNARLHQYVIR